MATPSITDLQSLVNRLTADNNRLRNLVKLYEASFAAMKPGKYYVCSDDGEVSSSYWKSGAAEQVRYGTRRRWNGCDGRSRDPPL